MVHITCISTVQFCNNKKRDFLSLKLSQAQVAMPWCVLDTPDTQCGGDRKILWVLCSKALLAPDLQAEPHVFLTCTGDSPTLPRLCRSHTWILCLSQLFLGAITEQQPLTWEFLDEMGKVGKHTDTEGWGGTAPGPGRSLQGGWWYHTAFAEFCSRALAFAISYHLDYGMLLVSHHRAQHVF